MKRFGMMLLAVLLATSVAMARQPMQVNEGQNTADSLAATADTLSSQKIPESTMTSFFLGVYSDSATKYIVQVSPNGTKWFTAFTDTCLAGTYDEHQLTTGPSLAGHYFRVIADNLTATTSWARVYARAVD